MKNVYINSVGSVSAQKTTHATDFLTDIISYNETVIPAIDPVYKDFIPPAAARRMAKGIKMSIVASKLALEKAGLNNVDAIITGTGMGCLRDSEKFLSSIIDNDEAYLTPTPFIQSTHNTVGGQIALEIQCTGYNFTYVHGSNSFESALLDAKLQLELSEAQNILIGGVDEIGDYTILLNKTINHIKKEPVKSSEIINSQTKGAVFGEGANFFVVSNESNHASLARIEALELYNTLPIQSVAQRARQFLKANNLNTADVDALILGNNGDVEFDIYYDELASGDFKNAQQLVYKPWVGEFHTASAFGLVLAAIILKTQKAPREFQLNSIVSSHFKTILLYNQYRGENHSFTLLRQC
ncbi:beta-ketoacyl synthase N-terminal-like domain-containing protein [Bizionia myxarmorum]|uniref:3-oxoacyl-ACP synthase n=1 Tax=Bizionia myxarmorum TaxID=291186 RepID=A0A5D0RAP9_9FLAO|nr:beta-ketoacyl synthase N-terminal-like domain-containing protein [Bizionia myxarmorum]TYB78592.1 3-oxoacyl-ACP synthase [Bizionia myxarmorum]